jgi:hypothetical protein
MDIVVIGSALLRNKAQKKTVARLPGQKAKFVDRRRNKKDRRKGVGDGVVVSLSCPNDRRVRPDRRSANDD